jgi:hypothetical protein
MEKVMRNYLIRTAGSKTKITGKLAEPQGSRKNTQKSNILEFPKKKTKYCRTKYFRVVLEFELARQMLYHLNHSTSPIFLVLGIFK